MAALDSLFVICWRSGLVGFSLAVFFFLEGSGKRIPEISFYFFMSANVLLIAQLLSIQCCRDQESVYTYADALVHVRLLDVEGNILHWSSES